jgi:periplasmic protein TonB
MQAVMDTRFARPALYGVLVTFSMFWTMHLLIEGGKYIAGDQETLATVDFVRLKKESELETRERKKPPKPEPPKQPPPPKMNVETPPPDAPATPFQMPKLAIPTNISGGPFLGSFTGGDLSAYSELIPLVRIAPQYPRNAARDGISGWVEFEVTINPDGTVRSARPTKAQPRGVFESAATQAIMKWKFKPKVVEGKGVESKGLQRIEFKMEAQQ